MPQVPPVTASLAALARVTVKRTLRRKVLWLAIGIAALPTAFAVALRGEAHAATQDAFTIARLLLAIIPALFVAAAIGEEIEDRTATYLWSRPLARWTLLVGKLIALAPFAIAVHAGSWIVASALALHTDVVQPAIALSAGALATSITVAAIATLVPRHGMALAIIYMIADATIGALPTSLAKLAISFHVDKIASPLSDSTAIIEGAIGLAAISLVWLALGLRRVSRLEV